MPPYVPLIRVFLSSPGDVSNERAGAFEVLERLRYDPYVRGKAAFDIVAWDKPGADTPMTATMNTSGGHQPRFTETF